MTDYYAPLPTVSGAPAGSGAVNGGNIDLGPTEFLDSSTNPATRYLRQPVAIGDPTSVANIAAVKAASTPAVSTDGAAVVDIRYASGSIGADFSSAAGAPALPNVGAAFANAGPYANFVLAATCPAAPGRKQIDVENNSGGTIAVILDDGTANSGALANASVFSLAGGAGAGSQGGSWVSTVERGRVQIYASATSAQVMVRQNT